MICWDSSLASRNSPAQLLLSHRDGAGVVLAHHACQILRDPGLCLHEPPPLTIDVVMLATKPLTYFAVSLGAAQVYDGE